MKKITIRHIQNLKGQESPFATITAYDFPSAQAVDTAGIPLILVGDSAAMVVYGMDTTIPVTMAEMLFLVRAVSRGAEKALVVADMPFMSYQPSVENAVRNAGKFVKEGGAEAVKLEGGTAYTSQIKAIIDAGIPVMGHVGLMPQSYHIISGYRIQGKCNLEADKIFEDALAVQNAGAFSVVLEGVPAELAEKITVELSIPTIGIGAGPGCDGQIQVFHDILGLYGDFIPKHAKRFTNLGEQIKNSISQYKRAVESKEFPAEEHTVFSSNSSLKNN